MNYFRHECQVATDILSTRQRPPTEHNRVLLLCLWSGSIGPCSGRQVNRNSWWCSGNVRVRVSRYFVVLLTVHRQVSSSWDTLYIFIFFQHSFQSYKFFLVFPFRCYLHYLISTPPVIAFLCKSGIWRNSDKEMYFVFLFWLRGCDCVRAVAPTPSRFEKGINCVLRTQGGVRWTPQKVMKEHESHKFWKMITVLYVSSHIDCRTVMAFKRFCRHGFHHSYFCTACIPECLGVGSCSEVR